MAYHHMNSFVRVAVAFFYMAAVISLVGFSTPVWILTQNGRAGLWRLCIGVDKNCFWFWEDEFETVGTRQEIPHWFRVCQALFIISIITVLANSINAFIYVWDIFEAYYTQMTILWTSLLAVVCLESICYIIIAAKVHRDGWDFVDRMTTVSWSYYLMICGTLMYAVICIPVFFLEARRRHYELTHPVY